MTCGLTAVAQNVVCPHDEQTGSVACATHLYALPGAPFIHKLVPNEGEHISGADFGDISTLALCHDRENVGNCYTYIRGTAPAKEGEYIYSLMVSGADGSETSVAVRLTVSSFLQSPTPMMGWLTWNWFARSISHDKMVDIARGMKKHGLIDAGFSTIVLDDAWGEPTTDKTALTYDAQKFPQGISGLKAALQDVHEGLRIGIYSDAGCMTCENYQPGSYLHESEHLALFDSWGVDMLKYDYCNSEATTQVSYSRMGDAVKALNDRREAEGRTPFVFNICEWGKTSPWLWGAEAGGSSWRATSDAREDWIGNASRPGVLGGVDEVRRLWMYAGVNRFNDLDMMCIGLHGLGGPSNNIVSHMSNGGRIEGLTDAQARSQMSLWCMMASPLSLTCDLRENPQGEANSGVSLPQPLITAADIEKNFHLDAAAAKKFKSDIEVSISGCSRITPHEMNEEFFEQVYPGEGIKDADKFRKAVQKGIEKANAEQCEILYVNQVRKALLDNFSAQMPEAFLKRWIANRGGEEVTLESVEAEWGEKYLPSLHLSLGIFLPLIAVNCAILGASLFMQSRAYDDPGQVLAYSLGSGAGWYLAIVTLAAIREKMAYSDVPKGLRGLGITFLVVGLMGLAFMGFMGIKF